jgi:BirA family biotin operon repressor/biotin-[acetyl-CoA-carboxylase] ligase
VLLLALEQTGGRGRGGRSWVSPPGQGIYATLLVDAGEAAALQTLPLLVPVGLVRALGRYLGCGIKWPNDLVVDGRKIGGVLIETLSGGGGALALVGFGVNHGHRRGDLPVAAATSLALEMESPPPLGRLAWELVREVSRELEHLGDTVYAVGRYRELAVHRPGDPLTCRVGEETLEGTFQGFDPQGYLRLLTAGGERRIAAGEVLERGEPGGER